MSNLSFPGVDITTLFSPFIYGNAERNARRMLWGHGLRVPAQEVTVIAGEEYEVSEHWVLSPPYWTRNPQIGIANWYLTSLGAGAEAAASNAQQYIGVSIQIGRNNPTILPLTVGGQPSFSVAAGDAVVTDLPSGMEIPPNTWCCFRIGRYNTVGSKRMATDFSRSVVANLNERSQGSAGDISGKVISGNVVTNGIGSTPFAPGPALIAAEGWDGSPVGLIFGTSIEYGQGGSRIVRDIYGEAGPIGAGLARPGAGAKRIPNANFSKPGAKAQAISSAGAGLERRKALIDLVTSGSNLPFTFIYLGGWTNDQSAFNTWIGYYNNVSTAMRALWPKARIIQATAFPRSASSDGFTTVGNQIAQNASWTLTNGDAWNVREYIMAYGIGAVDQVHDVIPVTCGFGRGGGFGQWYADTAGFWSDTLQAGLAQGAKNPQGTRYIRPGECIGFSVSGPEGAVVVGSSGTGSPFTYNLFNTVGNAHASGDAFKQAIIADGTHPSPLLCDRLADELFVPAKRAGLFG